MRRTYRPRGSEDQNGTRWPELGLSAQAKGFSCSGGAGGGGGSGRNSTGLASTRWLAAAASLAFSALRRSFSIRRISRLERPEDRAALERTPDAASAQAMQYGGLFAPNAYTRHSEQNSKPQLRQWFSASSKPCT